MTHERAGLPVLQDGTAGPGAASARGSSGKPEGPDDRRRFTLLLLGWIGSLGSLAAATAAGMRGLLPNLLDEPSPRFRAGKATDYADGVAFLEDIRVFLLRKGNSFRAMSAVCTHLGCTVRHHPTGEFRCPCHGSVFDEDGQVISGPAPLPLECFSMSVARDGRLVIDRERICSPDHYLVIEPTGGRPA